MGTAIGYESVTTTSSVPKTAIDTAVLLALASALIYSVSMSFECGYASFFGVPAKLVEANPKNTIICAATVLGGLPGGLWLWDNAAMWWPRSWHPTIRRLIVSLLAIPVVGLVFYFFLGVNPRGLALIMLPFFLYFVFSELVIPLLHRGKKTFVEKLEAESERAANELARSPRFGMLLIKRFGVTPFNYAVIFLVSCGVAFGFGFRDARTEDYFIVPTSKDDSCVFVTSYLDTLICASVDTAKHRLTGGLRFIQLHEASKVELQKLGRLTGADSNPWTVPATKPVPTVPPVTEKPAPVESPAK